MRILFVVGTLGKGGAERQLFYLCKLLISNGNEIEVLSFTSGEFYESKIKSIGVTVQNCKSSKNKLSKLFQIYKQTSNYKPDVIFGFHFYTGFYVGLVGRICSVLSIGSIRSNGIVEKESNGLFSWLHYAFPKLIIANSKNAIENVQHVFYKKSIEYLPNIIDFDYFSFQKKQKSNKISLLFIGSLKEIKQPNLFIDLVVQLIYNNCNLEAKIIGEGYLFNSLKLQAKNLPIDFLGNIDDIRPYLSEADFLISTSKFEGTPNVMLEAFASGTPVIAYTIKV
jgi:glycosyltransferase involved in cell wall biosynthesis